jgi:hypothetical protein
MIGAGKRKKGLVDVCSSLMTDAQSGKTMKPLEGTLNDPSPSAKPFAGLNAVARSALRSLVGASSAMCSRSIGTIGV